MESESWVVAAIGAVGVLMTAVMPWVIKFFGSRSEASRTQRADTIAEWGKYADRQDQRIAAQEKKLEATVAGYDRKIEDLIARYDSKISEVERQHAEEVKAYDRKIEELTIRYDTKLTEQEVRRAREVKELTEQQTQCIKENAEQRGEIKLLQATVARLQVVTGDQLSGSSQPGLIIANSKGIIMDANTPITAILQWPRKELVGQSVEKLIPKRFLEAHRAGMKAIVTSGKPPWPERVLLTYALTKLGDEVPVKIRLYGWQVEGGNWQISAEIQRRLSSGDSAVIKKEDLAGAIAEEARRGEEG